jgi:hypothetical protein
MNISVSRLQTLALSALVLVVTTVCVLVSIRAQHVDSSSSDNLSGYAWSETIGWLSFNCTDAGPCSPAYGVNVASNGSISGYAWSEHIGWVSFNAAEVGGCPSGTCAPQMNRTTGQITGWARALSGGTANAGGWDGWVSLSGANYGITVTGCVWSGYAWGSDVVGWVNFNGNGGTVVGTGNACVNTDPDLVPGTLTVPAVVKAGTTFGLNASVLNNSTIATGVSFKDNFTYQWNGTGGGWIPFGGNEVTHGAGIGANATLPDLVSFSLSGIQTGDLYIQHCVDSANAIDEKLNETPNCVVSSVIRVIRGDLTTPDDSIIYNGSTTIVWDTYGTTVGLVCEVSGDGITRTTHSGSEKITFTAPKTYTLGCGIASATLVPLDTLLITVDLTPELTVSPRTVQENGNSTLTADVKGQTGCTLRGGGKNFDLSLGMSSTTPIYGRTTFTLSCPGGTDSETVDVIGKAYET